MPRACCLLRISGDCQSPLLFLFSLFLPIELLGSSRKEYIAAAVEGGFNGVSGNEGKWYFVDHEYQADVKIYFVDHEYQAGLKVYFVRHEYQAGWRDNSKKNLLHG